jgi:glycyl-tRNA synthetase
MLSMNRICNYKPRVMEIQRRNLGKFGTFFGNEDLEDVKALIEELEIACPESGSRNWK